MPQVDFYVVNSDQLVARNEFVCKLVDKLFKLGKKVVIAVNDTDKLDELNRFLWAYPPESFIPHAVMTDRDGHHVGQNNRAEENIRLTTTPAQCDKIEVLINLCDKPPINHETIERLVEVVVKQPAILSCTRDNFRFYRECGYPIQSHDISR